MGKSNMQIIKIFPTNCFLLRTKNGYLLIDTSFPEKYGIFVEELEKRNIKLAEIKYLLLTHYHDDHTMQALQLK